MRLIEVDVEVEGTVVEVEGTVVEVDAEVGSAIVGSILIGIDYCSDTIKDLS